MCICIYATVSIYINYFLALSVRKPRRFNGHDFEQTLGDSEGQRSGVHCSPWGHKESGTT